MRPLQNARFVVAASRQSAAFCFIFLPATNPQSGRPSCVLWLQALGVKPSARMALLVSGPMDASFNCGNCFHQLRQVKPRVEMLHRRAAGERDPVRAVLQQIRARAGRVLRFGDGAVNRRCRPRWRRVLPAHAANRDSPPRRAAGRFSDFRRSRIWQTPRRFLRPSASSGVKSTCRCSSRNFAAVAGPTAAMRAPPRSRRSWKRLKNKSKNAVTPFALVNTSQS